MFWRLPMDCNFVKINIIIIIIEIFCLCIFDVLMFYCILQSQSNMKDFV